MDNNLDLIIRNIVKNKANGLFLEVLKSQEILRIAREEELSHFEGEPIANEEARLEQRLEAYQTYCENNEVECHIPRGDEILSDPNAYVRRRVVS